MGKVESPSNYFIISSRAGSKLPMHASASGKVFLANMSSEELEEFLDKYKFTKLTDNTITNKKQLMKCLQEIRNQGYSIENEEIEEGAYSIAPPSKIRRDRLSARSVLSVP